MGFGIMEVHLLNAKGLPNADLIGNMDPYVVIEYRNQERKSSVAKGAGSNPTWNEKFTFRVEYPGADNRYKITLRIMDKDTFSSDDFVGQAAIYVEDLLVKGVERGRAELSPVKYSVVGPDQDYCGEIKVGVTFTHQLERVFEFEEVGGWRMEAEWPIDEEYSGCINQLGSAIV